MGYLYGGWTILSIKLFNKKGSSWEMDRGLKAEYRLILFMYRTLSFLLSHRIDCICFLSSRIWTIKNCSGWGKVRRPRVQLFGFLTPKLADPSTPSGNCRPRGTLPETALQTPRAERGGNVKLLSRSSDREASQDLPSHMRGLGTVCPHQSSPAPLHRPLTQVTAVILCFFTIEESPVGGSKGFIYRKAGFHTLPWGFQRGSMMAMFQKSCLAFDPNQDVAAFQLSLIMNLELQKNKICYLFL